MGGLRAIVGRREVSEVSEIEVSGIVSGMAIFPRESVSEKQWQSAAVGQESSTISESPQRREQGSGAARVPPAAGPGPNSPGRAPAGRRPLPGTAQPRARGPRRPLSESQSRGSPGRRPPAPIPSRGGRIRVRALAHFFTGRKLSAPSLLPWPPPSANRGAGSKARRLRRRRQSRNLGRDARIDLFSKENKSWTPSPPLTSTCKQHLLL